MSRKRIRPIKPAISKLHISHRWLLGAACLIVLILVGALLLQPAQVPADAAGGAPRTAAPAMQSTPAIAKEYIHAGGRILATEEPIGFIDSVSDPYYADIIKIAAREVTVGCGFDGYGNALYCPGPNVTREQMAAFIMRALGVHIPPTPSSQRFADVPPSNIFYAYIEALYQAGITVGCGMDGSGNPLYCPSSNVTHAQMATFMSRAVGITNPPEPSSTCFADVNSSNQPDFYKFIYSYVNRGVWLGCTPCSGNPPQGNFCPDDPVTRSQMARILVNNFGF